MYIIMFMVKLIKGGLDVYVENIIFSGVLLVTVLFLNLFDLRGWLDKDPRFESGWATTNNGLSLIHI